MLPKLLPLAFVAKVMFVAQVFALRANSPRAPDPRAAIILCAVEDAMPHIFCTFLGGYSEGVEQEHRGLRRSAQESRIGVRCERCADNSGERMNEWY